MAVATEIWIKDKVYSFLVEGKADKAITGRIYKDNRPDNSELEDVEIAVLVSNVQQNQDFVVNVNVFVKDIKRENEWIEDTARLRTLCQTFANLLEYARYSGLIIELVSQHVQKVLETPLHVISNQIEIRYNSETT